MEDKLNQMLNDEKDNKLNFSNYTIEGIDKIDKFYVSDKDIIERQEFLSKYLSNHPNSIVARYLIALINLSIDNLDDLEIINIIAEFADTKKWDIVIFLSTQLLSYNDQSKFALNALGDAYDKKGENDKKIEVYRKLISVDIKDVATVIKLAEFELERNDINAAFNYYKKAIQRYNADKQVLNVFDLYKKLDELNLGDFNYFYETAIRVEYKNSIEAAAIIFDRLFEIEFEKKNYDNAIKVLKHLIDNNYNKEEQKTKILKTYKEKYQGNKKLKSTLNKTLLSDELGLSAAIDEFEKVISFQKLSFVFHKSWGVGRITNIDDNEMVIDFTTKRAHKMSLKMAYSSLQYLENTHIMVLKTVVDKKKLVEKFTTDISWAIRILINSCDEKAISFKQMKSIMVPSTLNQSQWTTWVSKAKNELLVDDYLSFKSPSSDLIIIRENPMQYDEKIYSAFVSEKDFSNKVKIFRDFLKDADADSEIFDQFIAFFIDKAQHSSDMDQKITSLFLLIDLNKKYNSSFLSTLNLNFENIVNEENATTIFKQIYDSETKKAFLSAIKKKINSWKELYIKFFPYYLTKDIPNALINIDKKKYFNTLLINALNQWKEYPDQLLYVVKSFELSVLAKAGITNYDILIAKLQLLDYTLRCIENHKDVSENRKYSKLLFTSLFTQDKELSEFLNSCTEEEASKIYPIIHDMINLDGSKKIEVKHQILQRFPEHKFYGKEEKQEKISKGLLVSSNSFNKKKLELDKMANVDIPENSKEIAYALSLGDLRENSEYKAAKEKQSQLQYAMAKLNDQIQKAQVLRKEDIDANRINFGTVITLKDNIKNKEEVYTILGPWESNPDQNIISYLAPFGSALLGKEKGDSFTFELNDIKYDFTLLDIKVADF